MERAPDVCEQRGAVRLKVGRPRTLTHRLAVRAVLVEGDERLVLAVARRQVKGRVRRRQVRVARALVSEAEQPEHHLEELSLIHISEPTRPY